MADPALFSSDLAKLKQQVSDLTRLVQYQTPNQITQAAAPPTTTNHITSSSVTNPTVGTFIWMAETVLASYVPPSEPGTPGTRTPVAWTTIDISAFVPANTIAVKIWVQAEDRGNYGGVQAIQVRSDPASSIYNVVSGSIWLDDNDLHFADQFEVPVKNQSFQYQVLVGFEDGWTINLQAYQAV